MHRDAPAFHLPHLRPPSIAADDSWAATVDKFGLKAADEHGTGVTDHLSAHTALPQKPVTKSVAAPSSSAPSFP